MGVLFFIIGVILKTNLPPEAVPGQIINPPPASKISSNGSSRGSNICCSTVCKKCHLVEIVDIWWICFRNEYSTFKSSSTRRPQLIGLWSCERSVEQQAVDASSNSGAAGIAAMSYIYGCFYSMGWGPLPWVYVVPTRTRHFSLASESQWL
jgi:hypothetical protein